MKTTRLGAACVCFLMAVGGVAQAAPISGQGTWETTLQGRDLDGDPLTFEAYYDTMLDITWLADANYAAGPMDWATANAWAASLNPYGSGITGWRLPHANPIDGSTEDDENISYIGTEDLGYNVSAPGTLYSGSTASEMAHLFYNTLGNKSHCDPDTSTVLSCDGPQAGWGLSNTGPFVNIQSDYMYWSAMKYTPETNFVWIFEFTYGGQDATGKSVNAFVWAVHEGDVSTVPIPAAAWLFWSGLLGLLSLARRQKKLREPL